MVCREESTTYLEEVFIVTRRELLSTRHIITELADGVAAERWHISIAAVENTQG